MVNTSEAAIDTVSRQVVKTKEHNFFIFFALLTPQ
jgi:hypothetical protein